MSEASLSAVGSVGSSLSSLVPGPEEEADPPSEGKESVRAERSNRLFWFKTINSQLVQTLKTTLCHLAALL